MALTTVKPSNLGIGFGLCYAPSMSFVGQKVVLYRTYYQQGALQIPQRVLDKSWTHCRIQVAMPDQAPTASTP